MIEAVPGYDVRGTFAVQEDRAFGWCWSEQRPGEALRVEVLSDGQVVASGIAARLVLELVRPGVTDGYHGYLLILPRDLPEAAILEAREARTGKVFARHLPKTLPDILAWQQRVAVLGGAVARLHDGLGEPACAAVRWSAAWGAGGGRLSGQQDRTGQEVTGALALRPFRDPLWTVILDLPRAGPEATEATARREVAQLASLLSAARAELVVIDDSRAAGFLAGVTGLHYAGVPTGAGDAARLNSAIGLARGEYVVIFAPTWKPDGLRSRSALLAEPPTDRVVVGGGAAVALRGAGLDDLLPLVEPTGAGTGLLLTAPRTLCEKVGALDPAMDDGADLALLDYALRVKAAGIAVHVVEDGLMPRLAGFDLVGARREFAGRWLSNNINHTEPYLICNQNT